MKTFTKFALVAVLLALPVVGFAAEFRTGEQPSAAREETIDEDLYIAGGSVSSAARIVGDLVVGGGTVLVSGPVSGDVIAGGGTVVVGSDVADDVRIVGGTIVVQGAVEGDIVAAGGQITLLGARIGGDVAAAGGTLRIDAPVTGDVKIAGGDIYLNASFGGDVDIQAEKITLGPQANIAGALSYSSPKEATMEEGAVVRGETHYEARAGAKDVEAGAKAAFAAFITFWVVAKFFMLFVGALVLAFFFKRYTQELVETVVERPLSQLGLGAVILIVLPVASVILLASIIGIPFGILGLLAYAILFITCALLAPIVIGSIVHKWIWKPVTHEVNWKIILLGTILYFVLCFIPVLGALTVFGVFLAILGTVASIKWSVIKEWC